MPHPNPYFIPSGSFPQFSSSAYAKAPVPNFVGVDSAEKSAAGAATVAAAAAVVLRKSRRVNRAGKS
jgi:hypothetical protein